MDIAELRHNWELLGDQDPLWAILSVPEKQGGKWNSEDFFATGVAEIRAIFATARALGVEIRKGKALDFGCGVGRMTQALCPHFASVVGTDLSATMIRSADRHNHYPAVCQYRLNTAPNLADFPSREFDFCMSFLVLQHMAPSYAKGYLRELCRVTGDKGIVLFQIPTRLRREPFDAPPVSTPEPPVGIVEPAAPAPPRNEEPVIEMHATPLWEVARLLHECGFELVAARSDGRAGPEFLSHEIWAVRG